MVIGEEEKGGRQVKKMDQGREIFLLVLDKFIMTINLDRVHQS